MPNQSLDMGKTSSRSESSAHADYTFEKKLQFYAKVRDTIVSLSVQKPISKRRRLRSRQKKLKAYDLSSLSEFLPELKSPRQPICAPEFRPNSKSRQNVVLKEGDRMRALLHHPAFQSDPLAAIHEHLKITQLVRDEKPARKCKRSGGKTKKGVAKMSKGANGPEWMQI